MSLSSRIRLRAMTLNIWNYNDPWQARLPLIAECIGDAAPDIIGLQEVRVEEQRSPLNQARQIARLLRGKYHCIYRPAMIYQRDPRCEEGLAILSRWPIAVCDAVQLTRDPTDDADRHQRIVLRGEIETPAGPLHFCNTHWSLSDSARERNAAETGALVARLAGAAPVILVGDLNSSPDGAARRLFCDGARGDALLRDAWAERHPDQPGFTFSSDQPRRRIDYVGYNFADARFGQLLDVHLSGDRPREGLYPSDHLGIIADFEVQAQPPDAKRNIC